MAEDRIDPDAVARLAQRMLTISTQLSPAVSPVGGSQITGDLGRAGESASIAGTYSAVAQGAVDAVDAVCGALEVNAEYVSYAAQQGDKAFN